MGKRRYRKQEGSRYCFALFTYLVPMTEHGSAAQICFHLFPWKINNNKKDFYLTQNPIENTQGENVWMEIISPIFPPQNVKTFVLKMPYLHNLNILCVW